MNLFVTHQDPTKSAQCLDDRRLNKMLTETVQILTGLFKGPYKLTHVNHPVVRWVNEDPVNAAWAVAYLDALGAEYLHRHGTYQLAYVKFLGNLNDNEEAFAMYQFLLRLKKEDITPKFCNCSYYKHQKDVFDAYRRTLTDKWLSDKITPKWTNRNKPRF